MYFVILANHLIKKNLLSCFPEDLTRQWWWDSRFCVLLQRLEVVIFSGLWGYGFVILLTMFCFTSSFLILRWPIFSLNDYLVSIFHFMVSIFNFWWRFRNHMRTLCCMTNYSKHSFVISPIWFVNSIQFNFIIIIQFNTSVFFLAISFIYRRVTLKQTLIYKGHSVKSLTI